MRVNTATRELLCKVVYYGPGMSGKTTNLSYVHQHAPSKVVSELVNIDTESERTIQFDLLPIDIGKVDGFDCRFEFYTVPGQSYYAATRRLVLEGADGIVFVADSRREAIDENIDSLNDMHENLRHHNLPEDIPIVVQYNKQDEPSALPPEQLNPLLNSHGYDHFKGVANQGVGVIETMKAIMKKTVDRIRANGSLHNRSSTESESAATSNNDESWLVTCCHCGNMLDIPNASNGDNFTCGACNQVFQIADRERGTTSPVTVSQTNQTISDEQNITVDLPESPASDDSRYSMQSLPDPAAGALAYTDPSGSQSAIGSAPVLSGFENIRSLDVSLLGTRLRVRHQASGQIARGLIINPALMRQAGYNEKLQTQVQLVSQVHHPNILSVTSMQVLDGHTVTFTQDAHEHKTLSDILAKRRTLGPPEAMDIIKQIALGLEEAARHGIVHGFLRTESILIDSDGKVLIDDIGVPKDSNFLVRESMGGSAATEYAFAPEHLDADVRTDIRTDIFLLGGLFFRMITGEGLITGYSAHEALHQVSANGPKRLRQVKPDMSRELDAFMSKLTTVDRKDRFQNYAELINELEVFGGGAKRHTVNMHQTRQAQRPRTAAVRRTQAQAQPHTRRNARTGEATQSFADGSTIGTTRGRKKSSNGPLIIASIVVVGVFILTGAFLAGAFDKPRRIQPVQQATNNSNAQNNNNAANTPASNQNNTTSSQTIPPDKKPTSVQGQSLDHVDTLLIQYRNNPADNNPRIEAIQILAPLTRSRDTDIVKRANSLRNAFNQVTEDYTLSKNKSKTPKAPPAAATPSADSATAENTPPAANTEAPKPASSEANPVSAAQKIRINELIVQERYAEAQELVQTIVVDPNQRADFDQAITNHYQDRRDAVQLEVLRAKNMAAVNAALEKPRTVWGITDAVTWANNLAQARAESLGVNPEEAVQQAASPAPASAESQAPTVLGGIERSTLRTHAKIVDALKRRNADEARRIIGNVDDKATRTMLDRELHVWQSAKKVMGEAFAERKIRHRVGTPYGTDLWDVVGIEESGLTLRAPGGSRSTLPWGQVKGSDLAALYSAIANDPAAKPDEQAIACLFNLHAGSQGAANLHLGRARKGNYPYSRDLEIIVSMNKLGPIEAALSEGQQALTAHDLAAVNAALEKLQSDNNDSEDAAPAVAYLEAAAQALRATAPIESGAKPAPNRLTFESPKQLAALTTEGNWEIIDGTLRSDGNGGHISAEGMSTATSANVVVQPLAKTGSFIISFRGVQVHVDCERQNYRLRSSARESTPAGYPFVPNIAYTFYFQIQKDGTAKIEINNKEQLVIETGALTNRFDIISRPNTLIAIDDLEFTRPTAAVIPEAQKAQQDLIRDILGWEPLGHAHLVAGRIMLPATGSNEPSGIALALKDDIAGIEFAVRGTGDIFLSLGDVNGTKDGGSVEIPKDGIIYLSVRRVEDELHIGYTDREGGALTTNVLANIRAPANFIIIEASESAVIPKTPKIIRR